jgi:hypothetical protein
MICELRNIVRCVVGQLDCTLYAQVEEFVYNSQGLRLVCRVMCSVISVAKKIDVKGECLWFPDLCGVANHIDERTFLDGIVSSPSSGSKTKANKQPPVSRTLHFDDT